MALLRRSAVALGVLPLLWSETALGQTWAGNRSTPNLGEIVAIDRSGETSWPYGAEDLAGDGVVFQAAEQAVDVRTAYAAATAQDLFARVYVSSGDAPPQAVTVFVFVDSDQSSATGGSAAATEIDPRLSSDPSPGGYEFVLGVRGDETVLGPWAWQAGQDQFTMLTTTPMQITAETGVDLDPILLISANHGYLQARIDLALSGTNATCDANLFFRSVSDDAAAGDGDLDVGSTVRCVPDDDDDDAVPDVLPPPGCNTDEQCPAQGICVNGRCILTGVCDEDADCPDGEECSPDERCVAVPAGDCSTNDECGALVCSSGQCVACTPGGSECGAGRRCAPDGRCVADDGGGAGDGGPMLAPGEEVQGGACACRTSRGGAGREGFWLGASLFGVLWLRRRRAWN